MMKILEISNFQSHLYSILEFHEGVNIIRGSSNHGKSAIVRALYWMIENRPSGEEYRNWKVDRKDPVKASVDFGDDLFVTRGRSTKFNGYEIPNVDPLEALRADVPEEVRTITQMDDTNIRNQDDGYFLLNLSSGNVARKLNEKAGLKDIDLVTKETRSLLDKYISDLKYVNSDIEQKEKSVQLLKEIEKHRDNIEELRTLTVSTKPMLEETKHELAHLIDQYERTKERLDIINEVLKISPEIDEINELFEKKSSFNIKHGMLMSVIYQIDKTSKSLENTKAWLSIEDKTKILEQLWNRRVLISSTYKAIKNTVTTISNFELSLAETTMEITKLELKLKEKKKYLNECPTCGADKKYWKRDEI